MLGSVVPPTRGTWTGVLDGFRGIWSPIASRCLCSLKFKKRRKTKTRAELEPAPFGILVFLDFGQDSTTNRTKDISSFWTGQNWLSWTRGKSTGFQVSVPKLPGVFLLFSLGVSVGKPENHPHSRTRCSPSLTSVTQCQRSHHHRPLNATHSFREGLHAAWDWTRGLG